MLLVVTCEEQAVRRARELAKSTKGIKLFETLTGKFLITDQDQPSEYREISYKYVNLKFLQQYDIEKIEKEEQPEEL
jgi:hypothetical protein